VGQLAVLFLTEADARVASLRQALVGHDQGALARSVHTLSGSSANLGANRARPACARTWSSDSAKWRGARR